jgi:two-component system sensor histidine kinase TctE
LLRRQRGGKPGLPSRLRRHVLLALALSWGLGSMLVVTVGKHFAAQAFDRALLDDAYALAAHVRFEGGALRLDLTPHELSAMLFDQSETVHFAMFGPGGSFEAGDRGLSVAPIPPQTTYAFSEQIFEGQPLHSVSLRRSEPGEFVVVVAQTTGSRTRLLQLLLTYSALAQVWVLLVVAWWLSDIIHRELKPLADLQQALDSRDAGDLPPLPAVLTHDATTQDVQRLGSAVDALLARLRESMQAQREFAGNVAHELRTPLAGIRAQASYALTHDDPTVWRAELQGILKAQERASRLVDQLLALARADEAQAGLTLEPVALDEVVRDVLLRYLPKADAQGVDLGAEGLDDRIDVRGDVALIEGILNNLLDNALRYGVGDAPRVTVALHREADAAVLSVTDNGPGLGAGVADSLTQRWAQGAQGRQLGEGAGLGLAITRRYAELLGARLAFGSGPEGRGLSAQLRFPLAR